VLKNTAYVVICLSCVCEATSLAADAVLIAGKQKLQELVEHRNNVSSIEVAGTAEGESDSKYRFHVLIDGAKFRTDRELLSFPLNPAQSGTVDRVAIVGDELRRNHSAYGASLMDIEAMFNTQVNSRLLGLSTSPLVFLKKGITVDQTVVGQLVRNLDHARLTFREIENVHCGVISAKINENRELLAFFDASMQFRGCEVVGGKSREQLWIQEVSLIGAQPFPKVFRTSRFEGDREVRKEVVAIEVNETIDPSAFEFSGLGLADGDSIDVRNGSLGDLPSVMGTYISGKITTADASPIPRAERARGRAPLIAAGFIFVALAFFMMSGLVGKRS
jgi:hypothetical protein